MKVKELKQLLENFNDDSIVLMSTDSEGNEYKNIDSVVTFSIYELSDATWCDTDAFCQGHVEVYRANVPEDVYQNNVAMIWPV